MQYRTDQSLNDEAPKSPVGHSSNMLADVLHSDTIRVIRDLTTCRCYVGMGTATSRIMRDDRNTLIDVTYRIGLRANAFSRIGVMARDVKRIAQRFNLAPDFSDSLKLISRKYSNFGPDYSTGDYSALICHLAKGFAFFATTGRLSWDEFKCGGAVNLRSVGVAVDPIQSNPKALFIPRVTSLLEYPATFSAMVGAAAAVGSTVYTDVVSVDVTDASVQLVVHNDATLAAGCYNALRVLLHIMDVSGCGSMGAYAMVKGIHSTITVVGHSDEGGLFRDVIRLNEFAPSYGGVFSVLPDSYCGLPALNSGSFLSFQTIVDSIALVTAGGVAVSDPLILNKNKWYPTVVTSRCNGANNRNRATPEDIRDVKTQIALAAPRFNINYLRFLSDAFNVSNRDSGMALSMMELQFGALAAHDSRHASHVSLSPFYWVEPTTLFSSKDDSFLANAQGYGVLAGTERTERVPYFEKVTKLDHDAATIKVHTEWRSARTNGFVMMHQLARTDGLAKMYVRQAAPDSFGLLGPGIGATMEAAMRTNTNVGAMLWLRGDSGFPHPAEALYIGKGVGILGVTNSFTIEDGWGDNVIKDGIDLREDPDVRINARAPILVPSVNSLSGRERKVVRRRTVALERFTQLSVIGRNFLQEVNDPMTLSFEDVDMGDAGETAVEPVPSGALNERDLSNVAAVSGDVETVEPLTIDDVVASERECDVKRTGHIATTILDGPQVVNPNANRGNAFELAATGTRVYSAAKVKNTTLPPAPPQGDDTVVGADATFAPPAV